MSSPQRRQQIYSFWLCSGSSSALFSGSAHGRNMYHSLLFAPIYFILPPFFSSLASFLSLSLSLLLLSQHSYFHFISH